MAGANDFLGPPKGPRNFCPFCWEGIEPLIGMDLDEDPLPFASAITSRRASRNNLYVANLQRRQARRLLRIEPRRGGAHGEELQKVTSRHLPAGC